MFNFAQVDKKIGRPNHHGPANTIGTPRPSGLRVISGGGADPYRPVSNSRPRSGLCPAGGKPTVNNTARFQRNPSLDVLVIGTFAAVGRKLVSSKKSP